jgi:hypothetical protein
VSLPAPQIARKVEPMEPERVAAEHRNFMQPSPLKELHLMRTNRILHNLLIVVIVGVVIGGFLLRPQKALATKLVDSSGDIISETHSCDACEDGCGSSE